MDLIPFDIKKAKAGAIAITECGYEARYLGDVESGLFPHVFAVMCGKEEKVVRYTREGMPDTYSTSRFGIVGMKPVRKVGWVNLWRTEEGISVVRKEPYDSREVAELRAQGFPGYLGAYKVEWEE